MQLELDALCQSISASVRRRVLSMPVLRLTGDSLKMELMFWSVLWLIQSSHWLQQFCLILGHDRSLEK